MRATYARFILDDSTINIARSHSKMSLEDTVIYLYEPFFGICNKLSRHDGKI